MSHSATTGPAHGLRSRGARDGVATETVSGPDRPLVRNVRANQELQRRTRARRPRGTDERRSPWHGADGERPDPSEGTLHHDDAAERVERLSAPVALGRRWLVEEGVS